MSCRTGVVRKLRVQPLRERDGALDALRAVEELRRTGDQHVEPGVATGDQIVDQLPQGVEALLAAVGPHTLNRLDLVEHEDKTLAARLPQHRSEERRVGKEWRTRGAPDP